MSYDGYKKIGGWNNEPVSGSIPSGSTVLNAETFKHMDNGIASAHDALSLINNFTVNSCVDVENGSYIGNGTFGEDNPTAITFKKGCPLVVFVVPNCEGFFAGTTDWKGGQLIAVRDSSGAPTTTYGSSSATVNICIFDWGGKDSSGNYSFKFWASSSGGAAGQFNTEGREYYYIAIVRRDKKCL